MFEPKTTLFSFHFDFTKVNDEGKVFNRGGEIYIRPCGWFRLALHVLGKYEDDVWLGPKGTRAESTAGEWPVSYHGTGKINQRNIAEYGYELCKTHSGETLPKLIARKMYTTPDPALAAKFAHTFEFNGAYYEVIIQNRVNPKRVVLSVPKETGGTDIFWVSSEESDIRPYGICIRLKK